MLKLPQRAAAIDIGTNSLRLLIADITSSGLIPLTNKLVTVRLGSRLEATRRLPPEAIDLALETLATFKAAMQKWAPQSWRACGTAALRQAENSEGFLNRASTLLGGDIEVISGAEEAALSLGGALSQLPDTTDGPLLLADVGGGSTELAYTATGGCPLPLPWAAGLESPGTDLSVTSLPLGAVSLTESCLPGLRTSLEELTRLEQRLVAHLTPALADLSVKPGGDQPRVIATGGTATALAALDLGLSRFSAERVQGHAVSARRLTELINLLARLTGPERNRLPGLDQLRGEILLAGVCVYRALLTILPVKKIVVSDAGLLEGILLSQLARSRSRPAADPSSSAGVNGRSLPGPTKRCLCRPRCYI